MSNERIESQLNRKKNYKSVFTILFVLLCAYLSARATEFQFSTLVMGATEMKNLIIEMWPPDMNHFKEVTEPMLDTIRMAVLGTTTGSILALPVAFLCASNVFKSHWVFIPIRIILNVIRTIPDLLLASLFVAIFGIGEFSGILALSVLSFGIVAKLFYESLEGIDPGPLEAMTAVGANKAKWITYGVVPQSIAAYFNYVLFTFEINIRAAAVLGLVGAGGIGLYYDQALGYFDYPKVTTLIIYTLVIVMVIDFVSKRVRRYFI